MSEQPWFQLPSELFAMHNLLKFYPTAEMNCAESLNAKTRLILYAAVLAMWRQYDWRTIGYLTAGSIGLALMTSTCAMPAASVGMGTTKKQRAVEPLDMTEQMTGIEQPEDLKNSGGAMTSYLSKEPGEAFPGANETARRLTTSTRETAGRTVVASTADEQRFRQRPVSTSKGIDSIHYNFMSGAVRHNKYVMNRV
jgi:hypothetical protein